MSVDSEEEDRQEDLKRSEMYKEFYNTKVFLKVYNRKKIEFDFKFPKSSYDRIIQLYGKETILPLSFVLFSNPFENVETIQYSSHNLNIRSSVQIDNILALLDNYYVYPASYEELDEIEKLQRAPKLKPKYLKDIAKKMGIQFSEMIDYMSLQMTEINVRETMSTIVNVKMYTIIFNSLHLLNVKFPDKESFDISFYSYNKMLKMAGIGLEQIIPYLEILKKNDLTREQLNNLGKIILFEKVLHRQLKESIDPNIRNKYIDLYVGTNSCDKIPRPDPIILEPFREETSNLLMKLIAEKEKNTKGKKEDDTKEENIDKEEENLDKEEENIDNEEENIDNKEENKTNEENIENEEENKDNEEENKDKEEENKDNEEENLDNEEENIDKEEENKDKEEDKEEENKDKEENETIIRSKINIINNKETEKEEEENKDKESENNLNNNVIKDSENKNEENKIDNEPVKPIEENNKKEPEKPIEENKMNNEQEKIKDENTNVKEPQISIDEIKVKIEPEKLNEENKDKINDINININKKENEKEEKKEPDNDNININIESHMILRNRPQSNEKLTNPEENKDKENPVLNLNDQIINKDNKDNNNKEPEKKDEIEINKNKLDSQILVNVGKEPNKEKEEINKIKIDGQNILKEPENKELENDKNKESINNNEPEKENEALKKNKIIGQTITIGSNESKDENEDKNKEIKLEIDNDKDKDKEESIKSEINLLNSKKVLRNKKNLKKNNDKENENEEDKNKIIIGHNDNIENNMAEIVKANNNENDKNINILSNSDNIKNMKVVNIPKKPKKKFKIRRAIFVKVEK